MKTTVSRERSDSAVSEQSSYNATTLAPPVFQLQTSTSLAEQENVEGSSTFYTENVSNFAVLVEQVDACLGSNNFRGMIMALEPLKHDKVEMVHFQSYFTRKKGMGFSAYLKEKWKDEVVEQLETIVFSTKGEFESATLAEDLSEMLESANYEDLPLLLGMIAEPKVVADLYAKAHGGKSFLDQLVLSPKVPMDVLEMAQGVFGAYQTNEKVLVANEDEAKEAREIVARIYEKYGVQLSSQEMLDREKENSNKEPEEMTAQLKTGTWTLVQLRSLEASLSSFGGVLGSERASTGRAGTTQEVVIAGRVNKHLATSQTNNPYISESTGGAYNDAADGITIYDNIGDKGFDSKYNSNGKNSGTTEKNVMTHELSHAFLEHLLPAFVKATGGYWLNETDANATRKVNATVNGSPMTLTQSLKKGAEAPPTEYGTWTADEDLAETVTLYFNNPSLLANGSDDWNSLPPAMRIKGIAGNPCPLRIKFVKEQVLPLLKTQ